VHPEGQAVLDGQHLDMRVLQLIELLESLGDLTLESEVAASALWAGAILRTELQLQDRSGRLGVVEDGLPIEQEQAFYPPEVDALHQFEQTPPGG